ncbi:50S ribosomal protein L10 [Patescibacteria group bacterium]|nr:50S ribosomal protein L10 [Patescibacteria group bacterium]MBU1721413.1 50S ribosomal protein L10 [Patescibacteria group bacterium]MBU1901853.1 50S ribosomal protein L10 [Patescibacteria group bacterium]
MAKTRVQKEESISKIVTSINEAKAVVFANYQGLTVSKMEELRGKCREAGITCVASKKTLVKRALHDAGMDVDTKAYKGGVVAFFCAEDEVSPAKIVAEFAKENDIVTIFGGVLEGQYIDDVKVKELSSLPSKEQLLAQLVGSLNAPISGFVHVLAGNLRGLVTVLDAIKKQKA